METKNILQSPKAKHVITGIGIAVIALLIFQAGVAVGFRKATFSGRLGDNYRNTFGDRRDIGRGMTPMMFGRVGLDGTTTHGTIGKIVSTSLPTILVADKDGVEKIITLNEKTETLPKLAHSIEENTVSYEYSQKEGIQVFSWADAIKDDYITSTLKEHFAPEFIDHYFAESFAGFGSGLVIVADKGVENFFEFKSAIKKSGSDFIVIIAEENSQISILENIKSDEGVFFGRTVFVFVKNGAMATYANKSEIHAGSAFFSNKFSKVLNDAKIEWYDLYSGAEMTRSLVEDTLAGNGAESYIYNLALCTEEHFDFYNIVRHKADNTASHIFARGIAGGGGKIVYRALSDIGEGVSGATGRQDGRFLIASSGAEIDAIPSLDIGSSESNSSHALSISHLNDKDFFYPALRGIAPYRASAMLLSGFLGKSLEKLPDEWQTKFLNSINKKLSSPLFRIGEEAGL